MPALFYNADQKPKGNLQNIAYNNIIFLEAPTHTNVYFLFIYIAIIIDALVQITKEEPQSKKLYGSPAHPAVLVWQRQKPLPIKAGWLLPAPARLPRGKRRRNKKKTLSV
jgi:hypothetical protein